MESNIESKSISESVVCPLVGEKIDIWDCYENISIADRQLKESAMPERFKQKPNWRDICLDCKYHID